MKQQFFLSFCDLKAYKNQNFRRTYWQWFGRRRPSLSELDLHRIALHHHTLAHHGRLINSFNVQFSDERVRMYRACMGFKRVSHGGGFVRHARLPSSGPRTERVSTSEHEGRDDRAPGSPGRCALPRRPPPRTRQQRSQKQHTHTHTIFSRDFHVASGTSRLHRRTRDGQSQRAVANGRLPRSLERKFGLPPLFLDVVRSCSPCFVWSRMSCVTASLFVYGMVLLPLLLFYPLNQVHTTTNIFNMYPPASQPHHAITPARHTTRTTRAQQHTAYQLAPRMPYTCSRSYILLLPYQITIHFAFFTYIVFAMYME